jgi:hypothetical protein
VARKGDAPPSGSSALDFRFGSKEDMCSATRDVRFGPIADSCTAANYFYPQHHNHGSEGDGRFSALDLARPPLITLNRKSVEQRGRWSWGGASARAFLAHASTRAFLGDSSAHIFLGGASARASCAADSVFVRALGADLGWAASTAGDVMSGAGAGVVVRVCIVPGCQGFGGPER